MLEVSVRVGAAWAAHCVLAAQLRLGIAANVAHCVLAVCAAMVLQLCLGT